jgi:5-methylcytosine-specific restriction enzyme subunit McrC
VTPSNPQLIELAEYETKTLAAHALPQPVGELLWQRYAPQVHIEPPTFLNGQQWKLTAQGWVGHIPLPDGLTLSLRPKLPLGSLFGMFEYAYRLKSFCFLSGLAHCQSLDEFYAQLARVLALRVLDRSRKGVYRAYVEYAERLPYVAGQMDVRHLVEQPWAVGRRCHYQEHTADVEENQILAWTLQHILRSGICPEHVLPTVRRAHRILRDLTTLTPCTPADCVGRLYNRLNDDYQPMHALCRFFLEHSGPGHRAGDRAVLPFLVDMARLYELFVAEWLQQHLPPEIAYVKAQDRVTLGAEQTLHFDIDLTLYDAHTHQAICVLDTKYKVPDRPSTVDISQVVTYAELKGCRQAVLIYPASLPSLLDEPVGPQIRVRSQVFSVAGDLEAGGQAFLKTLLPTLKV